MIVDFNIFAVALGLTIFFGQSEGRGIIPCNSTLALIFQCDDGNCIDRHDYYCDGVEDCPDGSDELTYAAQMEGTHGIKCKNRRLQKAKHSCHLPSRYICDHEIDCIGGQDECECMHTFRCSDGSCGVMSIFCDGEKHCVDGSDEILYNRTWKFGFQCPVTKHHESRSCVLPDHHVCDGDSICDDGIDECFCDFSSREKSRRYINDSYSNSNCFRCLDGSLIIPNKKLCDGIVHCPDLSDECLCTQHKNHTRPVICNTVCDGRECDCPGQVMCKPMIGLGDGNVCLPNSAICDYKSDCANSLDENYCPDGDQYFTCYDNKTRIKTTKFCNGVQDCEDNSDEAHCTDVTDYYCTYYRRFFPPDIDWEHSTTNVRIPPGIVLEPYYPFHAHQCDGIPTCPRASDECLAPGCANNRSDYCQFIAPGKAFACNNSKSLLLGSSVCDGMPDCNDTHPELSVDELFCPNRFYCKDKGASRLPIHIPLKSRCDGIKDCNDQSDEIGCSESSHFYCQDGGSVLFIRRTEACDGTKDCKSGADECQNCNPSPFSSDEKIVRSRVLVFFLWIIGLVAMFGNILVIGLQVSWLRNAADNVNQIGKMNRVLVLHLACADFLVGVYLVWLGITDASTTTYCLQDQEWRSSGICAALGTTALIGTELSVFILVVMTVYRLYVVHYPYKMNGHEAVYIGIFASWILAISIAAIPHINGLSDFFVSCVWYRHNEFFGLICKSDAIRFSRELAKRSSTAGKFTAVASGDFSWSSMFRAVSDLNDTYEPERYFGYYSAHSVCLPRLFPDPVRDISWGYSLAIMVLNFLAFMTILISYTFVYRKTTSRRTNSDAKDKQAATMQRKITRIVLTNFCCWIPICTMAFLKVSGVHISPDAYAVSAIILLPINAAMNPFLYTNLVDTLLEIAAPIKGIFQTKSPSQASPATELTVTRGNRIPNLNQTQNPTIETDKNL